MQQVCRRGQSHLIVVVRGRPQKIHPILAGNLLWHNRPRLRPANVPASLIGGENHTSSLPVDEILRSRQTQLRVFLVIAGIGQIISIAELHQPRVFYAAIFFVMFFRRKHRLAPPREMDPIRALSIAKARSAAFVLGPVKHYDFAVAKNHRRVERARRLPSVSLRRDHRSFGNALPRPKRQTCAIL